MTSPFTQDDLDRHLEVLSNVRRERAGNDAIRDAAQAIADNLRTGMLLPQTVISAQCDRRAP